MNSNAFKKLYLISFILTSSIHASQNQKQEKIILDPVHKKDIAAMVIIKLKEIKENNSSSDVTNSLKKLLDGHNILELNGDQKALMRYNLLERIIDTNRQALYRVPCHIIAAKEYVLESIDQK